MNTSVKRTFRSTLASTLGRHMLVVSGLVVAATLLQQGPAFDVDANAGRSNVPAWTSEIAAEFPACQELVEGTVAAGVVVVDSGAGVSRMSTDRAYALNTNGERADNVWVVGACL